MAVDQSHLPLTPHHGLKPQPQPMTVTILKGIFSIAAATLSIHSGAVDATGFQDLGTCFTARKGDDKMITDLGKCEVHFYSSAGSGTGLTLLLSGGNKVVATCPGNSTGNGWRELTLAEASSCIVNGEPGTVEWIRKSQSSAYCAWRHKDPIAYCVHPWNQRE